MAKMASLSDIPIDDDTPNEYQQPAPAPPPLLSVYDIPIDDDSPAITNNNSQPLYQAINFNNNNSNSSTFNSTLNNNPNFNFNNQEFNKEKNSSLYPNSNNNNNNNNNNNFQTSTTTTTTTTTSNNNNNNDGVVEKPSILPILSWNITVKVLEAKNLYITKKKYNPRCTIKIGKLLQAKTKESKSDPGHPVWNHSFDRVLTKNAYEEILFEIDACGTIFTEKIGTSYGAKDRIWIDIKNIGSDTMSEAEAADSIRGQLLIEIERSLPIHENYTFTFKWDEGGTCTIFNHFDTPVYTFVDNTLFTATNTVLMNAVVKNQVLEPKSHFYEMAILQNGTELSSLELSVTKAIKYHAGGPDSPAHWEKTVTMGCRKYIFDTFKKRYHTVVFSNGNTLDATYSNAKHTIEISHTADVFQILFLFAVSGSIPFPDKGRKR